MWHLALFPARPTRCHVATNHMQLQSIPSAFYATARQTQIKRPICTLRHFSIELLSLPQSAEWSGAKLVASCRLPTSLTKAVSPTTTTTMPQWPCCCAALRTIYNNKLQNKFVRVLTICGAACCMLSGVDCVSLLSVVCRLSSVAGLPRLGSLDFCNCSAVCACASRLVSSLANLAARLRLIRGSLQQQRQQPEPELEQQHGQQTLQHFQFLGSACHAHAQLTYHVEAIKGHSITISE